MFAGKQVRILLKGQAKEAYAVLQKRMDKESLSILHSIDRVIETLRANPQFGDPIRKALIPKAILRQGISNLYRAELSQYWRMLYTLEGTNIEIFLFILHITDHREYNKLFGYRKR